MVEAARAGRPSAALPAIEFYQHSNAGGFCTWHSVGADNTVAMDGRQELRLVTCLFIDVVGSTDATVRLGPERMQRLLGEAFREMSATVAEHGGVVEKYVGDAILALFGAPTSHANDAERALRTADACVRWGSASTSSAPGLAVRAGVETGELLVDLQALEARQRMVVGESINLAARLQQFAEPGQIVVGPRCHEATTAVADFEPMGELSLKGLDNVEGWRFAGFREAAEAAQVGFVGREAELAELRDAFERARRTAMLALIVGPPGQGKSRLAAEAIRQAAPARILEARCRPGTETGVNTPLRQLIESDLPDATPEGAYERLSALVGASEGPDVASALCHSSGLAVDERLLAISRYEQREIIAQAWQRYLEALAADGLLSVIVEDLHWADPVVLRVLDHVTSEVASPLLVLATARPEFLGTAHLRPRESRLQIDLGPLEPSAVERLGELAGDGSATGGASLERAAGNPLFIIELARSRSRPTEVPVTIQAAIAARLDELTPNERELLQRASVAGETFEVRDAALLGEREPGEVAAALGRFAHLGFVNQVGSSYRFHHILVRDVAYGRLPASERMALHARYAADGTDPDDVEAQAHHWWEALKPPDAEWVWEDEARLAPMRRDAYQVHMAAGARLEQRNAYEEATNVYLRAVELADATIDRAPAVAAAGRGFARQGRGDDAWTHRLRAIALYGEAQVSAPAQLYADMLEIATFNWGYFHDLPDDAEVVRLLDEGADLARASGDDVSLARLLAERAAFTGDASGTDEIHGFLERADPVRFADAAQRMATVYAWTGRVGDAVALFETVFEQLIPAGALINEPEALAWYGMAAFTAGDLAKADELADRLMVDSARRSVHTRSHAIGLKAMVDFGRGHWAGLERGHGDLRSLAEENSDVPFCLLSGAVVGYGAAADILAGASLPEDIDEQAKRQVDDSERIQAALVMLPKVMVGDQEAAAAGLRAYEQGLRLWDRNRVWDVADLLPGIALTILERWDALPSVLERLDEFAAGGAHLAEAAAAAIREEEVAARDGPPPTHDQLRALGYVGISELLHFRPALTANAAP
jgi:class 3 adenylate cyclase/tetratricopeptide (TPR) repeat protein